MQKILSYLKTYLQEELRLYFLLSILIFMGVYVGIEYGFNVSTPIKNEHYGSFYSLVYTFLSFLMPFAAGYLLYSYFYNDWSLWSNQLFWFLLLFGPFVFSLRTLANVFSENLYEFLGDSKTTTFYYKCLKVLIRDIIIFIPILVYWLRMDRKQMPLYGLSLKNYSLKPYLILLAIMLPLIITASFQGDFLNQYPKGFSLYPLDFNHPDDRIYFYIYELFYGFDFFFIEFFFRGFLLLAFFRHFGWSCLLPAACFYVSIHFGKPLAETLSSFLGGTILGVIAIRTGSIAGGIVVHVGVAWLMEFTALLHKLL
ncbi:MAG: CPBP family intramembrane metalloprotease [Flavobacteriales bacterium]|nr:CPBP family intramembrane metalloprotease [Flavobacteriales bacterium]